MSFRKGQFAILRGCEWPPQRGPDPSSKVEGSAAAAPPSHKLVTRSNGSFH